jgi:polygalacturonase
MPESLLSRLNKTSNPRHTTEVLQKAIDAAAECGGVVTVPPGEWTVATVFVRSGTTLRLERNAVLRAHTDLKDYPVMPRGHNKDRQPYHLIAAEDCRDITIEGDGTIDGCGEDFWEPPLRDLKAQGKDISDDIARAPKCWPLDGPFWRGWKPRISPLVELRRCRNVVLRDITIRRSPGWTVHPYCCDQVRIEGVTIDNHIYGPNTDGIDVNGCRDVFISNCRISGCDDNIILKATADARSTERVVVTNCILNTVCAALGIGAETTCGVRDVAFSNCAVEMALRMVHINMWEPGTVENVVVTNITGRTLMPPDIKMEKVVYIDVQSHGRGEGCELGRVRGVVVQGISAETRGRCIMTSHPRGPALEDIVLRDIVLRYPEVEDSAALAPLQKSNQNNNDNPEAQRANAVLVAENVQGMRVSNLSARMPKAGGGVPAMHGAWMRNVRDCGMECPRLAANDRKVENYHLEQCENVLIA